MWHATHRRPLIPDLRRQTHLCSRSRCLCPRCFFCGVFTAEVEPVRSRQPASRLLPLAGGILVVVVAVTWYTSGPWFFDDFSVPVFCSRGGSAALRGSAVGPVGAERAHHVPEAGWDARAMLDPTERAGRWTPRPHRA
ncbi:DUF6529 family protein [Streptomyces mirabilis]|uniref:DUF6529 family protein n=1 Tax=Streptomyces mirabilis TaxID=68239 RepID=UPI0034E9357F